MKHVAAEERHSQTLLDFPNEIHLIIIKPKMSLSVWNHKSPMLRNYIYIFIDI